MIIDLCGAIAYIAMAEAAHILFNATENSVPFGQRRAVLAALLAGAAVQMAQFGAACVPLPWLLQGLQVLAGLCLLAAPASFWPVVARLRRRRLRILNRRLLQRALRAEAAAAAAQKWLDLAEQSGHVGHWQLTVPDNRLIWSDEMYRIHGLWRAHYKPRIETSLAAFHPSDSKRIGQILQESVARQAPFEVAARLRRPDGDIRHVILRGDAQLDFDRRVEAVAGIMVDVTEPRRAEAKLLGPADASEIPGEDSVTGLADRQQFDRSLGYEFKRAVRSRKPLGMVLLEIDHFSAYVAHYGTMEADACLRQVAQSVHGVPRRTGDIVARYGAAGIAVLLPLADAAGAQRVANAIADSVRALGLPHQGHGSGLLTASFGAAAFAGIDDLYNPLELTRRAEQALNEAKAAGGGRVRTFSAPEYLQLLGAQSSFS